MAKNFRVCSNWDIARCVDSFLCSYPGAVRLHVHRTSVVLPVDVARALSVRPALIQKAVETFYTRDALQLRVRPLICYSVDISDSHKAVHRISRFPPEPSVQCTVKMTGTAYAQLVGQKFYPPKVFGRFEEKEATPEWRRRDIGMKIVRTDNLLLV